mmetsp:Transcript_5230/g.14993  ORF Transcript_5230/g.14993 Transcript_5230/m.14993 type:complete len:257 (+) Transcript_5230:2209-2979(+)
MASAFFCRPWMGFFAGAESTGALGRPGTGTPLGSAFCTATCTLFFAASIEAGGDGRPGVGTPAGRALFTASFALDAALATSFTGALGKPGRGTPAGRAFLTAACASSLTASAFFTSPCGLGGFTEGSFSSGNLKGSAFGLVTSGLGAATLRPPGLRPVGGTLVVAAAGCSPRPNTLAVPEDKSSSSSSCSAVVLVRDTMGPASAGGGTTAGPASSTADTPAASTASAARCTGPLGPSSLRAALHTVRVAGRRSDCR